MVNVIRFYTCADCEQRYVMKVGQHFKIVKTSEAALVCDDCFNRKKGVININVLLQTPQVPVEKPKKSKIAKHGKNSKTK